jgi:serine protease Do
MTVANTTKPYSSARLLAAFLPLAIIGFVASGNAIARADVAELRAREAKVRAVVARALPATVAVQAGAGMGSGVIVSEDGLVLTASHVSGDADREVSLLLSDGRIVKGKTLGANRNFDAGMVRITDEGKWPFVSLGNSEDVKSGDWCVCTGHPGGVQAGRTAPVRLGRIVSNRRGTMVSDCALLGGDSGGPLFDLEGRVIGIHSSIGNSMAENRHVPIDRFRESWDRMAKGEVWGSLLGAVSFHRPPGFRDEGGFLGVQLQAQQSGVTVMEVLSDSPAEKAGVKTGDVVLRFNGKPIEGIQDLVLKVAAKKPGTRVTIEVRRGAANKKVHVTLGTRGL